MSQKSFVVNCKAYPYKKQTIYVTPGPVIDGRFHYFFNGCDSSSGCKACLNCGNALIAILENDPNFSPTKPFDPYNLALSLGLSV